MLKKEYCLPIQLFLQKIVNSAVNLHSILSCISLNVLCLIDVTVRCFANVFSGIEA